MKTRDEDLRFVKHKEDGWTQREREMRGQGSGMSCKEQIPHVKKVFCRGREEGGIILFLNRDPTRSENYNLDTII